MSMGMGMGGGGHGGMGFGLMRSLRRDNSVLQQQLPKGIVRRIAGFARPYRVALGVFLVLIVIDAVIGAANPLIYRAIIDTGIGKHPGHGRPGLIVELALVVAGLAVFDAVLSLWQRWVSARIGEGLIFDMRTKVFAHIQKMPIAFFTRTQTGALVSRLNNDVLGAQQAFTDTFSSVVSNVIGVAITLGAMFYLSWPITLVTLLPTPGLPGPGPLRGQAPRRHHARVLHTQCADDQHHDRALQRGRGSLGEAVRTPQRRGPRVLEEGGPRSATSG